MADNSFNGIVGSMMKGMEGFLSSKTVVGEPIQIGDTTIVPLVDVSFGVGAGASTQDKKNSGAGGMSGKMSPSAVLAIKNGQIKLVNIKNQDSVTKVLDMIPDLVDKFTTKKEEMPSDEEVIHTAFPSDDSVEENTAE
ncbi:MAG: GerW family sporulation protein [Lachnospiraceae bacterium]|nr:GerW family sporulation protein [Lachnospiraceae bacterium]